MDEAADCLHTLLYYSFFAWFTASAIHIKKENYHEKNMGAVDRSIRTIIAIIIAVLYFTGQITGTAAIILGILAVVFLLTSFVGTCPLYLPVGLSTKKKTAN